MRVCEILPIGSGRAIKQGTIIQMLNIRNRRDLLNEVRCERLEGALIIADMHGGYYRPAAEDTSDVLTFIDMLKREVQKALKRRKSCGRR